MRKPNAIIVGVVAALTGIPLSSCSGGQPNQAVTNPSSTPVVTIEPTPAPTQEPTPAPTKVPTPEPTPNAAFAQWEQFDAHMVRDDLKDLLIAFTEIKPSNFKGYVAFAKKLRGFTKAEKTWLKSNPAVACYRPTFDHYSRAVQAYDKAALAMIAGYPTLRIRKIDEAYDAMTSGDGHLLKVVESLVASHSACLAA